MFLVLLVFCPIFLKLFCFIHFKNPKRYNLNSKYDQRNYLYPNPLDPLAPYHAPLMCILTFSRAFVPKPSETTRLNIPRCFKEYIVFLFSTYEIGENIHKRNLSLVPKTLTVSLLVRSISLVINVVEKCMYLLYVFQTKMFYKIVKIK